MSLKFELSGAEYERAMAFVKKCEGKLLEKQRVEMSPEDFEHLTGNGSYPYTGAIGGAISYTFNPTSVGVGVSVNAFGESADVTDYDRW